MAFAMYSRLQPWPNNRVGLLYGFFNSAFFAYDLFEIAVEIPGNRNLILRLGIMQARTLTA
jgi:hypothetical protein